MEWDPNERDAWVADAQRWIGKIRGVLQCKIDLDGDGEITGVHVVAGMERDPRHIVRDVESLLKARLGLDVYYKKIGVVQVLDNDQARTEESAAEQTGADTPSPVAEPVAPVAESIAPRGDSPTSAGAPDAGGTAAAGILPPPEPTPAVLLAEDVAPRLLCGGVSVMAGERMVRAEVLLAAGELEERGQCEGPNSAGADVTLVARAALDALGRLVADPILLHLNEIRQEQVAGRPVILAAVDLVEGRRSETLFGTCAAGHNRQQAIVHAVLDALNRRLSLYPLAAFGDTAAQAEA